VVKVAVVTRGGDVALKLYRTAAGAPDRLFAVCPLRRDGPAGIEPVTDSSRYFCLRIEDGKGNHAFIGASCGVRVRGPGSGGAPGRGPSLCPPPPTR
jgi:hypothetical protein